MSENAHNGKIPADSDARANNLTSTKSSEIPATKQFVVNATGNLFIATTLNSPDASGSAISSEAEEAFGQVSVFFAALTKAMAESGVSLFNFEAIDRLVSNSGLFVKITQSEVDFKSSQWGVTFGNELIQTLLGLSGNLASIGKSLTDMIAGIGKEANEIKISGNRIETEKKLATIIFVCEYLLGAVSITPIVISADTEEINSAFEAGPCFKTKKTNTAFTMQKTIYLFVPPSFVKHAAELNEAMSDPEFINLVNSLRGVIEQDTPAEPEAPAQPEE